MADRYTRKYGRAAILDEEKCLGLVLFLFLTNEIIMKVFSFAFNILGNKQLGVYVYILLQYGFTLGYLRRFRIPVKRWYGFALIWTVAAIGFMLSYMAHPENEQFFTRRIYGAAERVFRPDRAIYAYLFFRLCRKPDAVLRIMHGAGIMLVIYQGYLLLDALMAGGWAEYNAAGELALMEYSLVYGYQALFSALIFANEAFKGQRSSLIWMALAVAQIVLGGSRGPVMIFAAYCAFMVVWNWRQMSKVKYLIVALLLLTGILYSDAVLRMLERLGESSRTVRMLLSGSFSDDNGRSAIQKAALELIKTGGPFGRGIYGDRPALSQYHFAGFPHNLFLELLTNYGWLLGGAMCAIVCVNILKMVLGCRNRLWWEIYLIMLFSAMQLMISQSYWYVWAFWAAWAVQSNYRDEIRQLQPKKGRRFEKT